MPDRPVRRTGSKSSAARVKRSPRKGTTGYTATASRTITNVHPHTAVTSSKAATDARLPRLGVNGLRRANRRRSFGRPLGCLAARPGPCNSGGDHERKRQQTFPATKPDEVGRVRCHLVARQGGERVVRERVPEPGDRKLCAAQE